MAPTRILKTFTLPNQVVVQALGSGWQGHQDILTIPISEMDTNGGDYAFLITGRLGQAVIGGATHAVADIRYRVGATIYTGTYHRVKLNDVPTGPIHDTDRGLPFQMLVKVTGWTAPDDFVVTAALRGNGIVPTHTFVIENVTVTAFDLTTIDAESDYVFDSASGVSIAHGWVGDGSTPATRKVIATSSVLPWTTGADKWLCFWSMGTVPGSEVWNYRSWMALHDGSSEQGPEMAGVGCRSRGGPAGGATNHNVNLGYARVVEASNAGSTLQIRCDDNFTAGTGGDIAGDVQQWSVFAIRITDDMGLAYSEMQTQESFYGPPAGYAGYLSLRPPALTFEEGWFHDAAVFGYAVPLNDDSLGRIASFSSEIEQTNGNPIPSGSATQPLYTLADKQSEQYPDIEIGTTKTKKGLNSISHIGVWNPLEARPGQRSITRIEQDATETRFFLAEDIGLSVKLAMGDYFGVTQFDTDVTLAGPHGIPIGSVIKVTPSALATPVGLRAAQSAIVISDRIVRLINGQTGIGSSGTATGTLTVYGQTTTIDVSGVSVTSTIVINGVTYPYHLGLVNRVFENAATISARGLAVSVDTRLATGPSGGSLTMTSPSLGFFRAYDEQVIAIREKLGEGPTIGGAGAFGPDTYIVPGREAALDVTALPLLIREPVKTTPVEMVADMTELRTVNGYVLTWPWCLEPRRIWRLTWGFSDKADANESPHDFLAWVRALDKTAFRWTRPGIDAERAYVLDGGGIDLRSDGAKNWTVSARIVELKWVGA